jgi:hypothetical protein
MQLIIHDENTLQCNFNEPREGNLSGFSFLETLKKHKIRLPSGSFFKDSLFSSRKG